jgi:hypothetical protein
MAKHGTFTLNEVEAVFNKLGGEQGVRNFLANRLEVVAKEHIIDIDADPRIPYDGWKVEEHKKGGKLAWDPAKVHLHLSKNQQGGKTIEGNKLRKELESLTVLNANLLDYLLDNPHLIPEDWKVDGEGNTRYIYFWGTVYRDSDGDLFVRYLYFNDGHWVQGINWLDLGWGSQDPAAVLAS